MSKLQGQGSLRYSGVAFLYKKGIAPRRRTAKMPGRVKATGSLTPFAQSSMKSETPKKTKTGAIKAPTATKAATPAGSNAKAPLPVPSILLEGDTTITPAVSGPGQRYALGPAPKPGTFEPGGEPGELPEAYGTKRLHLTARDPYWVYAHWDLTREQLKHYDSLAANRHLVLRVYKNAVGGKPANEIHVHPESRNWFINVDQAGTKYLVELGYYGREDGAWVSISISAETLTPPDTMSDDVSVWFETLPADLRFDHLIRLVKTAVSEHVPLLEAIQQLRASRFPGLPGHKAMAAGRWTAEQERALGELVTMDAVRRVWMGSLEITELIRRQLQLELFSAAAAQFSVPGSWSAAVSSFSSPLGGMERRKGFWFNVNAELIIYGATEPDAEVTVGGRVIKLRPDGTFSFRFSLPDGQYNLPAIATSSDKSDSRSADLKFSRDTKYRGEVGQHPQDPKLKRPTAEAVA